MSSSVNLSTRSQSVLPRGREEISAVENRVVPVGLGTGASPGADDAAVAFSFGEDDEKLPAVGEPERLPADFAVLELGSGNDMVCEDDNRVLKIDVVFLDVTRGFFVIPLKPLEFEV